MLASKFFDDLYYNNAYYARVGGITNLEVNHLEMEMLRMMCFSLYVSPETYERYRSSLYDSIVWPVEAPIMPMPMIASLPPMPVAVPPIMTVKMEKMDSAAAEVLMEHAQAAAHPYHVAMGGSFHSHSIHQTAYVS
jgi:hypothetical protein